MKLPLDLPVGGTGYTSCAVCFKRVRQDLAVKAHDEHFCCEEHRKLYEFENIRRML